MGERRNGAVLVTGASSGVGRACALRLADDGYDVLACVRAPEDARSVEAERPGRISALLLDLRDERSIAEAAAAVSEAVGEGGLRGLVNSAGVVLSGPLEHFSRERWLEQCDVSLFGTMALTRAVLPLLRAARGRIVTIGAVGGVVAFPFFGGIASAKAALDAATACLRRELRPFGVHVSLVDPGGIDTPANRKMRRSVEQVRAELEGGDLARYREPMDAFARFADAFHKRNLKPERVARAVAKALRARRPRARYLVGVDSFAAAFAKWLLPERLFDLALLAITRLPLRFGAWASSPPRRSGTAGGAG